MGNYGSSQRPIASGRPEAKIIQKRGASANRTQADHSRRRERERERELEVEIIPSHEGPGNRMQCFHQGATNQEINSRVLFSEALTRRIWEGLFL